MKNNRRTQILERRILYLASAPQNYHGHVKQGKAKKLSQTIGDWGAMTTKCNVVAAIKSGTERGH